MASLDVDAARADTGVVGLSAQVTFLLAAVLPARDAVGTASASSARPLPRRLTSRAAVSATAFSPCAAVCSTLRPNAAVCAASCADKEARLGRLAVAVVVPVVLPSLEARTGRPTVKAVRAGSVAEPFADA